MLKSKFKAKKVIIGADLVKDIPTLISAYDDKKGVTAKFNKNILQRINTELGGDINLNSYKHLVIYNKSKKRIEMRLKCKKNSNIKKSADYIIKDNEKTSKELLIFVEKTKLLATINAFINAGYSGYSDNFNFTDKT